MSLRTNTAIGITATGVGVATSYFLFNRVKMGLGLGLANAAQICALKFLLGKPGLAIGSFIYFVQFGALVALASDRQARAGTDNFIAAILSDLGDYIKKKLT